MIPQEDFSGCSVACVANLLGVSYKEALSYFEQPELAIFRGYFCKEIVNALRHAGIESTFKYIKPTLADQLEQLGTIVYIAKSERYPSRHYLGKVRDGWLDPWINFPRLEKARAGLREELPGRPQYAIFNRV